MRNHVYPLDVLRFFAAFCVLSYHLCFFGWASDWGTTPHMLNHAARYDALAPFTWFGWIGVEIFFVISGFVIANSAYGRTPADFLKGRLLRLYPAAWICASLSLLAWLGFAHLPLSQLMSEYIRSLVLWLVGPWIDGVYWSLAVEIVFYSLVFCTLAAGRFARLTAIPWVLTGLTLVGFAVTLTPGAPAFIAAHALLNRLMTHSDLMLMTHGAYFAAGIWLWLMSRGEMTPMRYAGLAVAFACGIVEIMGRVRDYAAAATNVVMPFPAWAPLMLWVSAFALIVVAARAPHLFEVRSPLGQAALKRIGLMTYPMFLVHNVVGAGVIRTLTNLGVNQWVSLLTAITTVVALAYVICSGPEVEIRKRLRAIIEWVAGSLRRPARAA